MFDIDYQPPALKCGDELDSYHVVELTPSRIKLRTNYVLSVTLFVVGVAVLLFDIWLLNQRVLSHMLLAKNDLFWTGVKGAMIGLPLIGIPFILYSMGRSFVVDSAKGVLERRWLFFFGPAIKMDALKKVEIRLEPAESHEDAKVRLLLLDDKENVLLEFPSATAERDNVLSNDKTEFAKLTGLGVHVAAMTGRPLHVVGNQEAMSAVNARMLKHAAPTIAG